MKVRKRLLSVLLVLAVCVLPMVCNEAAADSYEKAIYYGKDLSITQWYGPAGSGWYSHEKTMAMDFTCNADGGIFYAPFTGRAYFNDTSLGWGTIWFQSKDKVHLANGETDYVTILLSHMRVDTGEFDEILGKNQYNGFEYAVIEDIRQGEPLYKQGGRSGWDDYVLGEHIDIQFAVGHTKTWHNSGNNYGAYVIGESSQNWRSPEEVLFLSEETNVQYCGFSADCVNVTWKTYDPCDHSKYESDGKCVDCGRYFNYGATRKSINKTVAASQTIRIRSGPYEVAEEIVSYGTGRLLTAVGEVTNAFGNKWYVVLHHENNQCVERYVYAEKLFVYNTQETGTYTFYNKEANKYLAVEGGVDAFRQNVIVDSFSTQNPAMQFELIQAGKGFKFRPLCSTDKILNVAADAVTSGTNVNILSGYDDATLWWYLEERIDGYIIHNVANPTCVLTADGTNVVVSNYTGNANQVWSTTMPAPTDPPDPWLAWWEDANLHKIYSTNAVLAAWINMDIDNSAITQCGIYLYDYKGTQLATKTENTSFSGAMQFQMWYDVNEELGYTLEPGTPYQHMFFMVIHGKTYYSPLYTFTTTGDHTHKYAGSVSYEPTCTRDGRRVSTCTTCGEDEIIVYPATGHSYNSGSVTTAPTCSNAGIKTYTCTSCGSTKTESIAPNGHSWRNATCTAPKTCSVCGAIEGEALGHAWDDATCTAPKTCSTCGASEGDALGHAWDDATCTVAKTCSVCGATEGEALGHTWDDATCTAPKTCSTCGATEGEALGHAWSNATCTAPKTCSTCGATEGEALGHAWSNATCTAPKTCSVCGATEGEALGHTWGDATCTAPKICSVCGATEGEALGHAWSNATCTAPKTCSTCGATEGEALGHAWDDATCTAPQTCTACGTTSGSALGHNCNNGVCTVCGFTEKIDFTYTISNGQVTITGYTGSATTVIIPSRIENLPVTTIGDSAFGNLKTLITVTIPDSVTTIEGNAFKNCSGLKTVNFGKGVVEIGTYAFTNCSGLTEISIPDSVTTVGDWAFRYCTGLKKVTIGDSITTTGEYMFYGCTALAEVFIPVGTTSIANSTFGNCTGLKTVYYEGTETQWKNVQIGLSNSALNSATIKYNSTGIPDSPVQVPSVGITNAGLVLKDYIGLQLALNKKTMNNGVYDDAYYTFTQYNPDGSVADSGTIRFNMATGNYVGAEIPVMAWSMADTYEVTVFWEVDGVTYQGATTTTSIKAQAMTRINKGQYEDLCVAMLNYGAAVQDTFNHNDADASYLANADLTAEQKAVPAFDELTLTEEIVIPEGDLKPANKGLSAKDNIILQFAVKNIDMSGYEVRYTLDGGEEIVIPYSEFMSMTAGSSTYTGPKFALTPRQLRSEIKLAFYDVETGEKVYGDIICSVAAFAKDHKGKTTESVIIAMMVYGDAALAAFGK